MSKGLILEGVVGTGKTTLYQYLLDHPVFVARVTKLTLPENYTERAIEHLTDKTVAASLALLQDLTDTIATLVRLFQGSKFCQEGNAELALAFLLERFHFTHAVMFNVSQFAPYRPIDEMLRFLDTRLVVCVVQEAELAKRLRRTREQRGAPWIAYLDRLAGRTDEMTSDEAERRIISHYQAQQAAMLQLTEVSCLPTLILDTTGEDWYNYAEQLIYFWGLD